MQLSDKLKEYLIDSLMKDKENLEREVKIKEDIIAKLGVEHGKEKTLTEDWKHQYFKLEEENCELKKKNKTLEDVKEFYVEKSKGDNETMEELSKENNKKMERIEELEKEVKESNDSWKEVYDAHNKLEVEKETLLIKVEELKKSQETHVKQYKELLDKYEIATAMNKSALNDKEKVKRG